MGYTRVRLSPAAAATGGRTWEADGAMRKALLKREHAALYPGVPPGVWLRAAAVAAQVTARRQRECGSRAPGPGRVLPAEHFTFTGGRRRRQGWAGVLTRLSDRPGSGTET